MSGRIEGKVAVITGAGSGLGRATAKRFAREGAHVVCADTHGAEDTARDIRVDRGSAVGARIDVSRPEDTERMTQLALEYHGRIDILVAAAGIAGNGTAADVAPEVWSRVLAVNLTGVWLSMQSVLRTMLAHESGSIVNIASIAGMIGRPAIAPYAAAKAGVIGLTRQAALDLGPAGIRVNAIAPGTVPTPLVTETWRARADTVANSGDLDRALAEQAARLPLRRLGVPADIASLALFLASEESSWITGQVHVVDGGMTVG